MASRANARLPSTGNWPLNSISVSAMAVAIKLIVDLRDGDDRWSMQELVQAVVIMAHFLAVRASLGLVSCRRLTCSNRVPAGKVSD